MKTYTAKGTVWGHLWGGGKGGYASEIVTGKTRNEVIKKATSMLNDGSLDSGMGYESLYGAYLTLTIKDHKTIGKKDFIHTDHEDVIIGKLSDEETNASFYL